VQRVRLNLIRDGRLWQVGGSFQMEFRSCSRGNTAAALRKAP